MHCLCTRQDNRWLDFSVLMSSRNCTLAVVWFEWYHHSFLPWYSNVTLYLAQCNRKFLGHNQACLHHIVIHLWEFSFLYIGMDALDIEKWKILVKHISYVFYMCVIRYLEFKSTYGYEFNTFLYYAEINRLEIHYVGIGAGCKSCFFPTILFVHFDTKKL